jgi:hypothetical protein
MDMKRRGRLVLEAAMLTPGICILLVYLVYFTLYAHDYAVLACCALESGVKGIYLEEQSSGQIEQKIEKDLQQKLSSRLLWIRDLETEVSVNPVHAVIHLTGTGEFLPVRTIEVEQKLYRVDPCETIRRSRWMREES